MKTPTGLSRSFQLRAVTLEFIDTDVIHMVTETGAEPQNLRVQIMAR